MADRSSPTLYGISNCDTVRKARQWLEGQGIHYYFHDVRKDGLRQETVTAWLGQLGWEQLINRRGTSWRQLPEAQREAMNDDSACDAILANPSLFKRPLLQLDDRLHTGFKPDQYRALFAD